MTTNDEDLYDTQLITITSQVDDVYIRKFLKRTDATLLINSEMTNDRCIFLSLAHPRRSQHCPLVENVLVTRGFENHDSQLNPANILQQQE
jgi:hypothetical protein